MTYIADSDGQLRFIGHPPAPRTALKERVSAPPDPEVARLLDEAANESRALMWLAANRTARIIAYKAADYDESRHPRYPKGHPRAGQWRKALAPYYGLLTDKAPSGAFWTPAQAKDLEAWLSGVTSQEAKMLPLMLNVSAQLSKAMEVTPPGAAQTEMAQELEVIAYVDAALAQTKRRIATNATRAMLEGLAKGKTLDVQTGWLKDAASTISLAALNPANEAQVQKADAAMKHLQNAGILVADQPDMPDVTYREAVESLNQADMVLSKSPKAVARDVEQWFYLNGFEPSSLKMIANHEATANIPPSDLQKFHYQPPLNVPFAAGTLLSALTQNEPPPPVAAAPAPDAFASIVTPICKWVTINGNPVCIDPTSTPEEPKIVIQPPYANPKGTATHSGGLALSYLSEFTAGKVSYQDLVDSLKKYQWSIAHPVQQTPQLEEELKTYLTAHVSALELVTSDIRQSFGLSDVDDPYSAQVAEMIAAGQAKLAAMLPPPAPALAPKGENLAAYLSFHQYSWSPHAADAFYEVMGTTESHLPIESIEAAMISNRAQTVGYFRAAKPLEPTAEGGGDKAVYSYNLYEGIKASQRALGLEISMKVLKGELKGEPPESSHALVDMPLKTVLGLANDAAERAYGEQWGSPSGALSLAESHFAIAPYTIGKAYSEGKPSIDAQQETIADKPLVQTPKDDVVKSIPAFLSEYHLPWTSVANDAFKDTQGALASAEHPQDAYNTWSGYALDERMLAAREFNDARAYAAQLKPSAAGTQAYSKAVYSGLLHSQRALGISMALGLESQMLFGEPPSLPPNPTFAYFDTFTLLSYSQNMAKFAQEHGWQTKNGSNIEGVSQWSDVLPLPFDETKGVPGTATFITPYGEEKPAPPVTPQPISMSEMFAVNAWGGPIGGGTPGGGAQGVDYPKDLSAKNPMDKIDVLTMGLMKTEAILAATPRALNTYSQWVNSDVPVLEMWKQADNQLAEARIAFTVANDLIAGEPLAAQPGNYLGYARVGTVHAQQAWGLAAAALVKVGKLAPVPADKLEKYTEMVDYDVMVDEYGKITPGKSWSQSLENRVVTDAVGYVHSASYADNIAWVVPSKVVETFAPKPTDDIVATTEEMKAMVTGAPPPALAPVPTLAGVPYCKWVTINGHPVCIDPNSTPQNPNILIGAFGNETMEGLAPLSSSYKIKLAEKFVDKHMQGKVTVDGLKQLVASKQAEKSAVLNDPEKKDKSDKVLWHLNANLDAAQYAIAAIEKSQGTGAPPVQSPPAAPDSAVGFYAKDLLLAPPPAAAKPKPAAKPKKGKAGKPQATPVANAAVFSAQLQAGLGLPIGAVIDTSAEADKLAEGKYAGTEHQAPWTSYTYAQYKATLDYLTSGQWTPDDAVNKIAERRHAALSYLTKAVGSQNQTLNGYVPGHIKPNFFYRDGYLKNFVAATEQTRGMAAALAVYAGQLAPVSEASFASEVANEPLGPPKKGTTKLPMQANALAEQMMFSNGVKTDKAKVLQQSLDNNGHLFLTLKDGKALQDAGSGPAGNALIKQWQTDIGIDASNTYFGDLGETLNTLSSSTIGGGSTAVPTPKPVYKPKPSYTPPAPEPEPVIPDFPPVIVTPFVGTTEPTLAYGAPPAPFGGLGKVVFDAELGNRLTHLKAAGGTQGAQWYTDTDGTRWIVKGDNFAEPDRVASELLANVTYAQLGLPVPEARLITLNGKRAYAAREVQGELLGSQNAAQLAGEKGERTRATLARGYIADAYLGNWDVVGMEGDNILLDAGGNAYRIDAGGSFFYRAQGEKKTDYGQVVNEIYSLSDPKRAASKVFRDAGLDEYTKQVSAMHLGLSLTDEWIDGNVDAAGFSADAAEDMKKVMRARRDWLVNHYKPVDPHTAEMAQATEAAGAQGMGLAFGGSFFKGGTVSSSIELSPTGNKEYVLYGKLRPKHEDILWGKIQGAVQKNIVVKGFDGAVGGYADPYAAMLVETAKTINFHMPGSTSAKEGAGDGAFNQEKLATYKLQVGNMLPTSHEGKHHAASVAALNEAIGYIESGQVSKLKPIPVISPAPAPPKEGKAPDFSDEDPNKYLMQEGIIITDIVKDAAAGAYEGVRDPATGLLTRTQWNNSPLGVTKGVVVKMETPEAELLYFASGESANMDVAFSRQGYLEVRSKDGTFASVRKALARFGIANHDTTVVEAEEAYLSRYAWWWTKADTPQYAQAHAYPTAEERLEAKRQYMSKSLGVPDVRALPEYNFKGTRDSRGGIYYYAPDFKRPQVPMWHHPYTGDVGSLPEKALSSGVPSMEATEWRLRKRLFLSGMSSTKDQKTGGAGHLFLYKGKASDDSYYLPDQSVLWRLTTFAQHDDQYGALEPGHGQSAARVPPDQWAGLGHRSQIMVEGGIAPEHWVGVVGNGLTKFKKMMKKLGYKKIGMASIGGGKDIDSLGDG